MLCDKQRLNQTIVTRRTKIFLAIPCAVACVVLVLHSIAPRMPPPSPSDHWPGKDGNPAYEPLVPVGETMNEGGLYDPSIAYVTDGRTGWLVYSAVLRRGTNYIKQVPIGPYCETHLARSINGGKTWDFVQAVNQSRDDHLQELDGQKVAGVWRHEVASIVHDPGDAGREWKIFSHQYFWSVRQDRMPAYGCITLQTASDPAGRWSEPEPFFGSDRFPPKPYNLTRVNVNALDPRLKDTLVYTEPGAFCRDGTLYLSLTAVRRTGPEKIALLASTDHARTWRVVNILVSNGDARQLGYDKLDGSAIAQEAGRVFLLVSPGNRIAEHLGTMVIEFADLATGQLKRDPSGKLIISKHLREQPDLLPHLDAGVSCYDEHNTYGGILMAQMVIKDAPQVFQIWSTRQSILGGP